MRRRGNILMMAVFIAVFLFFLSVALVTANRQDIMLSLSVDHRLRAQMAARAGSDVGLATARVKGLPAVDNMALTMESGARYSVDVRDVAFDQGVRHADILATGTSGFVSSERSLVVERIPFGPELSGSLPLLFGKDAAGNLKSLGPSFKWTELGALPRADTWLAAGGGPLCVMAPRGTADPPPKIYDFVPQMNAEGVLVPTLQEVQWPESEQPEHLLYMTFEITRLKWVDIPDPGSLDGQSVPPMIDGDPEGTPRWQTVNAGGTEVTWTDSQFTGQVQEWYGLTGPALTAENGVVYCHANHYLFKGTTFQNQVQVVNGAVVNNPSQTPSKWYKEPAVLAFDLAQMSSEKARWVKKVDLMTVEDPNSDPVIDQGPRPDFGSLAVVVGVVYAYDRNDYRQVLRSTPNLNWDAAKMTEGVANGLCAYNGSLRTYVGSRYSDSSTRTVLEGLDPNTQIRVHTAEIRGDVLQNGGYRQVVLDPELILESGLMPGVNGFASYGEHLWTTAHLRVEAKEPGGMTLVELLGSPGPKGKVDYYDTLVHFDGKSWQVWPMGLQPYVARTTGNAGLTVGGAQQLSTEQLAFGLYQGQEDPLERLVPIVVRRR
ncbi:MAG: hypothetical protein AB1758_08070 [Candidatus Eremiobacterota bacterium]